MSRERQKATRNSALVDLILVMVLLALIGSVQAYSTGGPYNYIDKKSEIQKVLRGQDLQFLETANWSAVPVIVFRVAGGSIENTYTADASNRIFKVNWPSTGAFYVNYDVTTKAFDAQLSVEDPSIPIALKVNNKVVSSIVVETILKVDVTGINLYPEDIVDLKVIGPDGQIQTDAVNNQQFTGITVQKLTTDYSGTGIKIKTAGWKLGSYTFQIETLSDNACGLQLTSEAKVITLKRKSTPTPKVTPARTPSPPPTLPPPTTTPKPTPTTTPTPEVSSTPVTTPPPTLPPSTLTPTPAPQVPGFEAGFTLAGFGIMVHLLRRRRGSPLTLNRG